MNDYFRKIIRLYFQEKEGQVINPISEIDAKIITEVLIALDKTGQGELRRLLLEWKQVSDAHVHESIIEFNLNKHGGITSVFGDDIKDEESKSPKKLWITLFDDFSCRVPDILSFEKDQMYDTSDNRLKYLIVLNRCDEGTKLPLHANKTFKFLSQELRDEKLRYVKALLVEYNNIRFL